MAMTAQGQRAAGLREVEVKKKGCLLLSRAKHHTSQKRGKVLQLLFVVVLDMQCSRIYVCVLSRRRETVVFTYVPLS